MPISLQLIAAQFQEATLIRAARYFEDERPGIAKSRCGMISGQVSDLIDLSRPWVD